MSQFALAFICCAMALSGCATWEGPRIDPTGNSLLIWPGEPAYAAPVTYGPPVVGPPPGAVVVAPPPPAPVVAPIVQPLPSVTPSTPFGNVLAPPVYSDPTSGPVEPTPLMASVPPPVVAPAPIAPGPPVIALPPPPGMAPNGLVPVANVVPAGCDHLEILPTTLVAPVGSEMLLKARIYSDGHFLAGRRVNWNIVQGSVGQFTDMGFRDRGQVLSFWEAPHKFDEFSALSQTAVVPITLNTGLDNPCLQIPIERGDAWVTLTSACEGASVISACTPVLDQFNQATATIYWIDAQWVFPQTAPAEAGRPYTLTTTVMRRSDGAPLPGWIVRYDVAAGAGLGYEGGASTESTTDGAGRASVEVSPRDGAGGATNVGITIIRPATGGPVPMPRLEVGRAATTITWGAAGVPVGPAPSLPAGPVGPSGPIPLPPPPISGPPPSLPADAPVVPAPNAGPPANPYAPNPYAPNPNAANPNAVNPNAAAATGTPRLSVTLGTPTPAQVAVGDFVSFELTVANVGDGLARHIVIQDQFDRGLNHDSAQPGVYSITNDKMGDLPPGQSAKLPLTFKVVDGGMQCHNVTVSADGVAPVKQQGCVTARSVSLKVEATVPRLQVVGDVAKISAVLRNVGEVTATRVEFVAQCDPALSFTSLPQGATLLQDGRVLLQVESLAPGERRPLALEAVCKADSKRACVKFIATASGGAIAADEQCFEIRSPIAAAAPGAAGAAAGADGLVLRISTTTNPARVGQSLVMNVEVENAGQQIERDVRVLVKHLPELTTDPTKIKPDNEGEITSTDVRFKPIAELAPAQRKSYLIMYTPTRTGRIEMEAQVGTGTTLRQTVKSSPIDILGSDL